MKFKLVIWMLGFLLERASKKNPRVREKLQGQDLVLEIACEGGYARHFIIQNQKVMSYPGKAKAPVFLGPELEPTLSINFENASTGFQALTAKDKQLAMISGIHEKRIKIEGNPLLLMWFQSLAKLI